MAAVAAAVSALPADLVPGPLERPYVPYRGLVHESLPNCLAWSAYRSGLLQYNLTQGSIQGVRLTSDLLKDLVPGLPRGVPLSINVQLLSAPTVCM